jgi:CRISPR-associated protein Cas5d
LFLKKENAMSARYPPQYDAPLEVHVWGDFACFTRPEMKVERVTYPVPTPSAMRGLLEAIFWKPEFAWRIEEIWVLRPIRYFSILRNEVNNKMSDRTARGWAKNGGGYVASEDRAQRNTLALRDVEYVVRAQIELKPHATEDSAKYRDQFRRRVQQGRCFTQPYLGCREFSAHFGPVTGDERPIQLNEDLGLMLLDMEYAAGANRATPRLFPARLEAGVLRISPQINQEV